MEYYQILGISKTSTAAEIRRAYRKLAVIYHPDKNPDPKAESFFKEINRAYEVLSDPDKRRAYDLRFTHSVDIPDTPPTPPRHRDPKYRPRTKSTTEKRTRRIARIDGEIPAIFPMDLDWLLCFMQLPVN